eukprot:Phypoly_transcript_05788.p1 GENE.Phypoly_transcript_05788~~Phypoly_transcript_05788.p1  ORF type:complete len:494 (-),score=39.77 Phypoly_transcript_05788:149-1630(-)
MGIYSTEEGVMEYTPLTSSTPLNYQGHSEHKLYTRRWYILFMFSLLSATQCCLWISYSAVAETTKAMYNTSSANVNFLAATGPLAFIPLSSLTSWAIGEYSLRFACIGGALLCAIGAVIRCFATESSFWIVILAQFLNAAAGPVVMNAPPAISATWFGVNERTLSTAIGTIANSCGSAAGFFIGLRIHTTHDLKFSLYYEAAFSLVLLIGIVIYFPSHPPTPPTNTSTIKRDPKPLVSSIMELLRESARVFKSWSGVLILLAAGIANGFSSGWGAMLVLILKPYYSQHSIQWLGLFNIVGAVLGGLIIGKLHDHFRHFKLMISGLFFVACGVFVVFSLATERIIICTFMEIMALNIAAGAAIGATSPVSYEALVEVTYPVKEEVSAGLMSLVNNFACLAILIIGDYKTGNFINWTMAAICLGCFPRKEAQRCEARTIWYQKGKFLTPIAIPKNYTNSPAPPLSPRNSPDRAVGALAYANSVRYLAAEPGSRNY